MNAWSKTMTISGNSYVYMHSMHINGMNAIAVDAACRGSQGLNPGLSSHLPVIDESGSGMDVSAPIEGYCRYDFGDRYCGKIATDGITCQKHGGLPRVDLDPGHQDYAPPCLEGKRHKYETLDKRRECHGLWCWHDICTKCPVTRIRSMSFSGQHETIYKTRDGDRN